MEVMLFLFAVGYVAIILIGVVVALVWSIRRRLGFFKTVGVVLATLFVIYAIPFGDHTLGEIKKHQLCRELGGTKIYQVVENVDGFMWLNSGGPGKPYTTHGYSFYEASALSGEILRYRKRPDGSVDEERVSFPQARYAVRQIPYEYIGKRHSISKFVIIDIKDNKVLASHGTVAYDGGWLRYGSLNCSGDQPRPDVIDLIHKVLIPAK